MAAMRRRPASIPTAAHWRQGFTLLELCLCLVVVGFIAVYSVTMIGNDPMAGCSLLPNEQLARMQAAIDQFVTTNRRYPLPASRNIGITNPKYGVEVSSPLDSSVNLVPGLQPVLIGAVPHATLGLSNDDASDCWGSKFTYAVTQSMTTTLGYASQLNVGGIILRNGTLTSWQLVDPNIAYLIFSHGPMKLGASAANYSGAAINCNATYLDITNLEVDKENCDTLNAIFVSADTNYNPGNRFFDDTVVTGTRPPYLPPNCPAETVSWGMGCQAPALLTLLGLSINVTNVRTGFTGVALSTCTNGVRSTVGLCLPLGL